MLKPEGFLAHPIVPSSESETGAKGTTLNVDSAFLEKVRSFNEQLFSEENEPFLPLPLVEMIVSLDEMLRESEKEEVDRLLLLYPAAHAYLRALDENDGADSDQEIGEMSEAYALISAKIAGADHPGDEGILSKEARDLLGLLFFNPWISEKQLHLMRNKEWIRQQRKRIVTTESSGEDVLYHEFEGVTVREVFMYEPNPVSGNPSNQAQIYIEGSPGSFGLAELLPEGWSFVRVLHDRHSIATYPDTKTITYDKIDSLICLFALLHEVGHSQEKESTWQEYSGLTEGKEEYKSKLERNADAYAMWKARSLVAEGYVPETVFSNERLRDFVNAQLFDYSSACIQEEGGYSVMLKQELVIIH